MNECTTCKYAEWDEFEYYGGAKEGYVCGCRKDNDIDEPCEDYEEIIPERKD